MATGGWYRRGREVRPAAPSVQHLLIADAPEGTHRACSRQRLYWEGVYDVWWSVTTAFPRCPVCEVVEAEEQARTEALFRRGIWNGARAWTGPVPEPAPTEEPGLGPDDSVFP